MLEALGKGKAERGPVQQAVLGAVVAAAAAWLRVARPVRGDRGRALDLNSGQIYSSLERLARDGLVVETGVERGAGPDKRLWALTEAGEAELRRWFHVAVPRDYRLRDEFYLKLMLALVTRTERPHRVLQVQRRELFQELHDLTARRSLLNPREALARILMLDSAIMHTEAELRWLDMIESRLDEIRDQPLARPRPGPADARARGHAAGDVPTPAPK